MIAENKTKSTKNNGVISKCDPIALPPKQYIFNQAYRLFGLIIGYT